MCPCCAVATHVAVPGSYALGTFGRLKRTGRRLWAEGGPWAPRRLVAIEYIMRLNDCMRLPTDWDWAAHSLEFTAPHALVRGAFLGALFFIPAVAQAKANTARTREPEPERSQTAPKRPMLMQGSEPWDQMMAPVGPRRLDSLIPPVAQMHPAAPSPGMDQAPPFGGSPHIGTS